jgi:hypothetical protein
MDLNQHLQQQAAQSAPAQNEGQENIDLTLAANTLFDEVTNTCSLSTGEVVSIRPAKMGQINLLIEFFARLINGIDKGQLADLIEFVVLTQSKAIAEGKDPYKIDLTQIATDKVVSLAVNNTSLISTLLMAVADEMPKFAEAFAGIKAADYKELTIDDGLKLVGSIFLLNYSFFTERLPPILTAFIRARVSKHKMQTNATPPVQRPVVPEKAKRSR